MTSDQVAALRRYGPAVQAALTPVRWQHSLGVMAALSALAPIYALDPAAAACAGLLHDVAKDLAPARQRELAQQHRLALTIPADSDPVYLHGPLGAALVRSELGLDDPLVLAAIAAHCHGQVLDGPALRLGWCLRCADLLAPVRPWTGMRKLHELAHSGNFDTMRLVLNRWVGEFYTQIGLTLHPALLEEQRQLHAALAPAEAIFERW